MAQSKKRPAKKAAAGKVSSELLVSPVDGPPRRSVIITFKPKDKRPDPQTDKVDIVRQMVSSEVEFFDTRLMGLNQLAIPRGVPADLVAYDVNEYEAPIVIASLTEAEIRKLESNGNVEAVEEDGEFYAVQDYPGVPQYPYYPQYTTAISLQPRLRENLFIEGQPSPLAETVPAGIAQVKAPAAWDASRGKGIRVAVLDTGIDHMHPDLAPNFRGGISFVPGQPPMDGNSHGTHCAGTIAAAINGAGVVGVAPAASLYAVKVLSNQGNGNWSWLIAGIDWCINNGIHILSMSLGGGGAPAALENMCNVAFNKGLLLVAAAGNNAGAVLQPATYNSVIAVSAIDSANVIAAFSNRGPKIELCAPGVSVLSTIPGGGYGNKSGTSMACPHVSGAAALAWGAHRYSNNITIRRLLAWTSDNLGVPGRDNLYGFGRVDAEQAAAELALPPAIPGLP